MKIQHCIYQQNTHVYVINGDIQETKCRQLGFYMNKLYFVFFNFCNLIRSKTNNVRINVALMCISLTTTAVEKQQILHILWVCL